ncbi:hypothetical protein P8C59_000981 [Phyllachora maydis]|uniref:Nickel/cobalt efflux system n=1 Tax=Phyllachora maydis TaxID=1825666 RepID=A0AAD9HXA4_9PEZI|nr:hypothetical protein P8C59_000981 [Phyllachora maydis]
MPTRFFRLPGPLRARVTAVPPPVAGILSLVLGVNVLIGAATAVVLHSHPGLVTPAALCYTLGLRHALDADHISAIDLMTRRLVASGQRPVAVGTFFSLGHSTVVVVTCVVVAATAGALQDRFGRFQQVGGIIGTAVSAVFLLVLSAGNGWVLCRLVRRLQEVLARPADDDEGPGPWVKLEGAGFLARLFRSLFRLVDRPWKMFPLGLLFGLGFDTSSEVALLGLASLQGAQGTSLWLILIFPVLFTAAMCLLDTTDGALMMTLYTAGALARDPVAILYYSIVLTAITVSVSLFVGIVQALSLVQNVAGPQGRFWDGVGAIGDHFDVIGGAICGLFLLVGLASVLVRGKVRSSLRARKPSAGPEVGRHADVMPADISTTVQPTSTTPAHDEAAK